MIHRRKNELRFGGMGEGLTLSEKLNEKIIESKRRYFLSQVEGLLKRHDIGVAGVTVEDVHINIHCIQITEEDGTSTVIDFNNDISGIFRYTILEILKPKTLKRDIETQGDTSPKDLLEEQLEVEEDEKSLNDQGPELRVIEGSLDASTQRGKSENRHLRVISESKTREKIANGLSHIFMNTTADFIIDIKSDTVTIVHPQNHDKMIYCNGIFDGEGNIHSDLLEVGFDWNVFSGFLERGKCLNQIENTFYSGGKEISVRLSNGRTLSYRMIRLK